VHLLDDVAEALGARLLGGPGVGAARRRRLRGVPRRVLHAVRQLREVVLALGLQRVRRRRRHGAKPRHQRRRCQPPPPRHEMNAAGLGLATRHEKEALEISSWHSMASLEGDENEGKVQTGRPAYIDRQAGGGAARAH
jgi:hypothetical protein